MQRVLSEVWLSVLAASAAVSFVGCDPGNAVIDEFAEQDGDIAEENDLEHIEADVEDEQDGLAPMTPPLDPAPDDLTAAPGHPDPAVEDLAGAPDDPILCLCTDAYEPVCGIDGETYQNPCTAFCAGVDVDHAGKCDCLCTLEFDPVCGENGKTYGNACAAACAGVAVTYEGTCTGDNCTTDEECVDNQFCQRDGVCGGLGVCEIMADACPNKADPVCGCDGQTYESACMAHVHGVSVSLAGSCDGNDPPQDPEDPPPEF